MLKGRCVGTLLGACIGSSECTEVAVCIGSGVCTETDVYTGDTLQWWRRVGWD